MWRDNGNWMKATTCERFLAADLLQMAHALTIDTIVICRLAGPSEAPIGGALRHFAAGDRRFHVDKNPTRRKRTEQPAPAALGEDTVRHGEDQPVETAEPV